MSTATHSSGRGRLLGDRARRQHVGPRPGGEAGHDCDTIEEYGRVKNAMIQQILARAGFTDTDRERIPTRAEVPR